MLSIRSINPLARAIGIFSAVAIVVTGVTAAALQSQATLTDNTISSATATLEVDNIDNGLGFSSTDTGFSFTGLVPGADYGAAQHFSLKNTGTADLKVTVYATLATATGTIDKTKVHVRFTNNDTADVAVYTMANLEAIFNDVPGVSGAGFLDIAAGGEENDFDVQVKLDADAIIGSSASLGDFNLVFTGSTF